MKSNVERWRGVAAWMGLVCLGLLSASSLSAQEPKLRAIDAGFGAGGLRKDHGGNAVVTCRRDEPRLASVG